MTTSSPGSSSVLRTTFSAPPAPHDMITLSAPKLSPVSSLSCAATAPRVSGYPALGMYLCIPGDGLSAIRFSSAKNSGGGSMTGFPRDRSNTASAPYFWLRAMPSSNILRIHEPCTM